MDISFRKARVSDQTTIEALFIEMLRSVYQSENVDGYENDYLLKFFGTSDDCVIVAESNSAVIGYIAVVVNREGGEYAYLDDFCVKNKYRNLGIGTQLLLLAEAYATEKRLSDIRLHVEMTNASARKLYEKNGYEILRADGSRLLMRKTQSKNSKEVTP